ncbi:MAG: hypothetical protein KDC56_06375 [Flavobacteriaceae bacterium]|nr:hypothetical protein [Flavobacteriaceae bacterium]
MENTTVSEGKTIAIISYITWIGTLIAFIMNNEKKNSFASFHIRQMIGLIILQFIEALIRGFVNGYLGYAIWVFALVLWIIGIIGAVQGEEKKVPLLGDQFQDWFKSIG